MKTVLIVILMSAWLAGFAYAGVEDASTEWGKCYTLDDSAQAVPSVVQNIFAMLRIAGGLEPGFPLYGREEVVGDINAPHTSKAVPVKSMEEADAILFDGERYIAWQVWGLNTLGHYHHDRIFLLKEEDEDAVRNGLRGLGRYKYLLIMYPIEQSLKKSVHIRRIVRKGIVAAGAESVACR